VRLCFFGVVFIWGAQACQWARDRSTPNSCVFALLLVHPMLNGFELAVL
jgi:hypothetical protein